MGAIRRHTNLRNAVGPAAVAAALLLLPSARPASAQNCQVLRYTFQPDCLRAAGDITCQPVIYQVDPNDPQKKTSQIDRLDLGPQIAVWIESADRAQFIDTLMVTNMVAARGIGNRPGLALFVSGPKFPYGKRQMALPIWAYSRGQLYDTVMFQDNNETQIGFHESCSSPDPYHCRPMQPAEIAEPPAGVDAIACPSAVFNSSKGKLNPSLARSYYPPRNDLGDDRAAFISRDCDVVGGSLDSCTMSALTYPMMNDLDAVAAATPPYGQAYSGTWHIPPNLAPGDYAVWIEINKEYDRNDSHNAQNHPSTQDPTLAAYGLAGNFGQPSVVYRVPIHIDGLTPAAAGASQIEGYSDWMGGSGAVIPRDATITVDQAGSGEGRLLQIAGPAGNARFHVSLEQCAPVVCDPPPDPPGAVVIQPLAITDVSATGAVIHFANASVAGAPAAGYEIRYRATESLTMTDDEFSTQAIAAPQVVPGAPSTIAAVSIDGLKPATHYVLGIRTLGPCPPKSSIMFVDFTTTSKKFTQLSGCFIATAAYGSEMDPAVTALRALRDRLRPRSALFAVATELYYRSGPAAADLIGRSDTARAAVRRLIGPPADLARVITTFGAAGLGVSHSFH